MRFIGLDIHKDYAIAAAVDPSGTPLRITPSRFDLRTGLVRFAEQLEPEGVIALEASTNVWPIYDLLVRKTPHVLVANPIKTRAIAEARIKTDELDALTLAKLACSGFIAEVWIPDPQIRDLRILSSHRQSLSQTATRLKNKVHALLKRSGISAYPDFLFTQKGRNFLATLSLPPAARWELDSTLRILDTVERELVELDRHMATLAIDNPQAQLLMQIPGINFVSALVILGEIGDIRRFPSSKKLCSYSGLLPRISQSGQKLYTGRITKAGRKKLRWILVEAAQTAIRNESYWQAVFERIAAKKGRNVAIVAVARKILTVIWHMLTKNQPYQRVQPALIARKLQETAWTARKEGRRLKTVIQVVTNGLRLISEEVAGEADTLIRRRSTQASLVKVQAVN